MVTQELEPEMIAQQLGTDGVDKVVANAELVCGHEGRRIALSNQSEIVGLQMEYRHLDREEGRIDGLLRSAPPSGRSLRLRLEAVYYWTMTVGLVLAGTSLTVFTFAPFRLGGIAWTFAMGVAMVTPLLVEIALGGRCILVRTLATFGALAATASLMLLADVRGNLLDQQLRANQEQAVVIDDAQPPQQSEDNFYERSNRSLHLALLLLAFGMEVGAGLALHEAWRRVPDSSEDWNGLRRQLAAVRQRKVEIVRVVVALQNESEIFHARFWRDFYRAMLTTVARSALTKMLLLPFALAILAGARAHAQAREDLVIAIDLTASVSVSGPDGKSEFEKNVDGVAHVLAQAPAGSRITVIGITDHSFAQPYILLTARVGADPGYFGERLTAAHNQLVRAWRLKSSRLDAHFAHTDILGALRLAGQIFAQELNANKKSLVLFSDMRQNTPELDLESPRTVPALQSIVQRCEPLAQLRGVEVTILGADGAGHTAAYWQSLQQFWIEYFERAGTKFEAYSTLRDWRPMLDSR